MILERLTLTDVGPYAGTQTIELAPRSKARPVILITALNGAGKTTLFDALLIALYGKHARLSKQGGQSYDAYLARLINREADPSEGASIELQWRYRRGGEERVEQILRTWTVVNGRTREHCQILVKDQRGDFVVDPVLSERWYEHVDELLPVQLSNLFFFDGEQIATLADLDRAREVLRTGIHALLGVDLVDQLETDLGTFEKKQRLAGDTPAIQASRAELESLEATQRQVEDALHQAEAATAQATTQRDQARKNLTTVQRELEALGGDQVARRADLERALATAEQAIAAGEDRLREILAGDGPLLLVQDQLAAIAAADVTEVAAKQAVAVVDVLAERDQAMLGLLAQHGSPSAMTAVTNHLAQDRARREQLAKATPIRFDLDPTGRANLQALLHGGLDRTRQDLTATLAGVGQARTDHERLTRTLARIPTADAVAPVLAARDAAQGEFHRAEGQCAAAVARQHGCTLATATARKAHEVAIAKLGTVGIEDAKRRRRLHTAAAAREALGRFRTAMLERHLVRIADHISASFRTLARKKGLIRSLRIEPVTYALSLRGLATPAHPEGRPLDPDDLSAGERQLLALSILGGLAKASGRPLPTVIDTPLGRLDSAHRLNVVERYLPKAAAQVLVLSTDTEIVGPLRRQLLPYVGRAYCLINDDGATLISEDN